LPLAAVECRAIGRDGDDRIFLIEVQTLGGLDRGEEVGDAGQTDQLQPGEQLRVDMTPVRQIEPAGLVVEQQVELPCAAVGYADHDIGVHDVVN